MGLIMNTLLKIIGLLLLIAGFVLAYRPDLVSTQAMPTDPYQMIEKRVGWGFAIGLGLFLIFHPPWLPWGASISGLLFALTLGIIAARLLGFVLDGLFVKQWLWLAIELLALLFFGWLYWKLKSD